MSAVGAVWTFQEDLFEERMRRIEDDLQLKSGFIGFLYGVQGGSL